jgi:hypothetical protein
MRVAIFDRVNPPVPNHLPFQIVSTCSHRAAAVKLAFAVPAALGVAGALLMVLYDAVMAPGARDLLAQHPVIGLEIFAAIAFLAFLLVLPIKRLCDRLVVQRTVGIEGDTVSVNERGHLRSWSWNEPLDSYSGLAHHVRASLSGTRHELILVHPKRHKSVLLSVAPSLSQNEVARVAALLGHREIPARELYRVGVGSWRSAPHPWREAAHA